MSEVVSKERSFEHLVKMDAVNLQGVWPLFPKTAARGGWTIVAGLWQQMYEEWLAERKRKKKKKPEPTGETLVKIILGRIEKRLVRDEADDLIAALIL